MHSRIFEVITVEDGADYTPTMSESDFYDYIPYKFDYVNGETDLVGDIDWLKSCCECLFVGEDVIEISKLNKEKYFANRFIKFKHLAEEITLEEFATGHSENWEHSIYNLRQIIREDYAFFVWVDGCLEELDDFVRYYADRQYKIVSSMDYHF